MAVWSSGGFGHGREAFEPVKAGCLRPPFVFIKLRQVHALLSARFRKVAQRFCRLRYGQPLPSNLRACFLHRPLYLKDRLKGRLC